jgi:hypothetical protein
MFGGPGPGFGTFELGVLGGPCPDPDPLGLGVLGAGGGFALGACDVGVDTVFGPTVGVVATKVASDRSRSRGGGVVGLLDFSSLSLALSIMDSGVHNVSLVLSV